MGHIHSHYARIGFRSLAPWRCLITGSRNRAGCGKARISLRKVKDEVWVYKCIHHSSGLVFARVAERIEDKARGDVPWWLRCLINQWLEELKVTTFEDRSIVLFH
ncbi:hypothetical protein HBI56_161530 [Parastagonospora nodorum]|uniref:Uncharacterized protein n=1 Tax=Phaeosphaeria nodorum (strain SN15 / ATCC MYA-4574 / FGSC 10173) TaxID=321614 RepID=A0A7U2NPS8_PHANO|nr:hypothetical protein HBH56_211110 [Parastagonospora nodorum]QRD05984.1 hypothetical protein JI435_423020 [Parastagonospora nodorum SN15]KAH3931282.1 hypothetical protein HBH54_099720 [Parastagonospora nodorum]KAH3944240.1 hypothetical protein HBH53_161170 [Parastagonospora nodorum]KAH3960718.1 hypothetical protein HBH51_189470 [Parastagonospora nodorum]